jgi:hypothetical protein
MEELPVAADKDIERLFQQAYATPLKTGVRSRSYPGKTTGLTLYPFLYMVLKHQEELDQDHKVTDGHILEMVKTEFGERSIVYERMLARTVRVCNVRAAYNKKKPALLSLCYSLSGFPQMGMNRVMKLKDARRKCFHFKVVDPRFFTPSEIATISQFMIKGIEAYQGFRLPTLNLIEMYPYGSIQFLDADTLGLQHLEREVGRYGSA